MSLSQSFPLQTLFRKDEIPEFCFLWNKARRQTMESITSLLILLGRYILVVYVNGIMIIGSDYDRITRLKQF
jgi:hypothetical protein